MTLLKNDENTVQQGRPLLYPVDTPEEKAAFKEHRKKYTREHYLKNKEAYNIRSKMYMRRKRAEERIKNNTTDAVGKNKVRGPYRTKVR